MFSGGSKGNIGKKRVKLAKYALKFVTNDRTVCAEVLRTFFIEVESKLNSRPLTLLTDDRNDIKVLAPNHQ